MQQNRRRIVSKNRSTRFCCQFIDQKNILSLIILITNLKTQETLITNWNFSRWSIRNVAKPLFSKFFFDRIFIFKSFWKPKIKISTKLWWRRINLYNYDLAILLFFFFSKIRKIFKRSRLSRKLSDAKKSAKIKESLEERNGRRETIARLKSAEEEEGVITEWPCSLVTVSVFQADIFTVISTSGWSEEPVFRFFFVELPRKIYRYIYIRDTFAFLSRNSNHLPCWSVKWWEI